MNYELIGKKIREERKKQNLTIEDLAELFDISANFIGKIERAQSTMSLETLISIVNALNISTDDILSHETNAVSSQQISTLAKSIEDIPNINKKDCFEIVKLVVEYYSNKR